MTSRSANYDATALNEFANDLAGQVYDPDTQCAHIQGTGAILHRVSINTIP